MRLATANAPTNRRIGRRDTLATTAARILNGQAAPTT